MGAPTPWSRFVMPHAYAPSPTGAPLPGAQLFFYASGTSTPLNTFNDAALSQPNPNPVIADANGLFPDIFLQSLLYKVILRRAPPPADTGVIVMFADPVAPYIPPTPVPNPPFIVLEVTKDGNGGVPLAGLAGDQYCPADCTIQSGVLMANIPGDISIDVWVAPFVTNTPPSALNSIVASDPLVLSSSVSSIDTTLPGWSLGIPAGSQVRFNISEIDTLTRITAQLNCVPGLP